MGNRVARLATPCFAAPGDVVDGASAAADAHTNGGAADDNRNSVMHILSLLDGSESPAKAPFGSIHGALLPSNQSTMGSGRSILNNNSDGSSSSFGSSSHSFSFRTLQYSGPLTMDSSSPSTSAATSLSRHNLRRTDGDILRDIADAKQRRQSQAQAAGKSSSPVLAGLRRAVSSALRGAPCVSPSVEARGAGNADGGDPFVGLRTTTNGGGAAISSSSQNNNKNNDDAPTTRSGAGEVQWARGKAGEDQVHVVVDEQRGWTFVGIYDGFNGPDATDYLVAHLYHAVARELELMRPLPALAAGEDEDNCDHDEVLQAMARALHATETGYFAEAEARAGECPELAMMGSCVLVVLMRGDHVYVMNVGDSRAVLARQAEPDLSRIVVHDGSTEEIVRRFDAADMGELAATQLTMDHSTTVYKEVRRIQSEHLDDPSCIVHDRVKGSLKVTRAFGAGYLKDPRWNRALLEVFRVDYVGTAPYISCRPHLRHHRLGSRDKFIVLSSDGLYEYFTNQEVVLQVDNFTACYPGEDPAKYLSHEILCRAANRAGMEIHELLEVQQGDRRRYHDDVSIIIISLEGKILYGGHR
ncbi:hypothetical protein QOZ80_5AG0407960 [Eleusine coracana subsp. coracana]|nr:hypothetical protein QOZ80_5AG0407960 [Eleusine coracana subsp. coracana]